MSPRLSCEYIFQNMNVIKNLTITSERSTIYGKINGGDFRNPYPWWHHQMETFLRYWPFVRGIHRSTVNSRHKGQWHGTLMFSSICAPTNVWVNNCDAGDLKRHDAHYDVIVMHWLLQMFAHVPTTMTIRWKQRRSFLLTHLPHGQYARHFADVIFRHIFVNEKFRILIQISLKFVSKDPMDNKTALVQVMAWRWTCEKPLTEPMLTPFTDAYTRHLGAVSHHGVVLCRATVMLSLRQNNVATSFWRNNDVITASRVRI